MNKLVPMPGIERLSELKAMYPTYDKNVVFPNTTKKENNDLKHKENKNEKI